MTGRLVIGFDGSDLAEDALVLGVRLAQALNSEPVVAVVHPESPPGMGRVDAEWVAAMRDDAGQVLDRAREVLAGMAGDLQADYRAVGATSASRGLDELAESSDATALVIGSGRGGPLRRTFLGSTSERLLQGAAVPVVVAPRGHRTRSTPGLDVVGCAYLDTPEGHEALRAAAAVAGAAKALLRIFTVVAPVAEFAPIGGRDAERAFVAEARDAYQRGLDRALAGPIPSGAREVTGELLEGNVVDALAALDDRDVDLLVCGSRGYGPIRRVLLGGTAARLVRHAASPVMVVPRSASGPLVEVDRAAAG